MTKRETFKFIVQIIASVATAIVTALGATSCMNVQGKKNRGEQKNSPLFRFFILYSFLLIAEAAGEVDGDGGTLTLFGLERDFAIHTIDDGLTDRQAQPGILIKHVERLVALKHI